MWEFLLDKSQKSIHHGKLNSSYFNKVSRTFLQKLENILTLQKWQILLYLTLLKHLFYLTFFNTEFWTCATTQNNCKYIINRFVQIYSRGCAKMRSNLLDKFGEFKSVFRIRIHMFQMILSNFQKDFFFSKILN